MKIAFTTNLCAHYNIGTFELLSHYYDVDYYFFSDGGEWYWPKEHKIGSGKFHFENLGGFRMGTTRVTLSLPMKLIQGKYDIYIKCINGRFALPVTYIVAKIMRKPFILWTGIWNRIETRAQKMLFPLTLHIYKHSDAIVVYGEHVKQYLINEGVPSERIFVAAHAVDNEFYGKTISVTEIEELREELHVERDTKVILYLGRLEESKGVRYLVDAFGDLELSNAILLIAGEGSLRPELEELSRDSKNSNNIRFIGYVPIDIAPLYYSLAWIYILPSITIPTGKEPWGLVVNEAMNQGVPVIATEAVGAAMGGLVNDGINGFVIPEKDSSTLARRIKELIDQPDLRNEMSRNARRIISSWNYERNVQGYREAIEYVMRKP